VSLSFDGVNVSITALHSSNDRTSINLSLHCPQPSVARDVSLSKQNVTGLIQRGEAVLASTKAAVVQLQEILARLREWEGEGLLQKRLTQ
jgi:hypothetical protein